MGEGIDQKSLSETTRTLVLIIFCALCWGILWNQLPHLFLKVAKISLASLFTDFAELPSIPSGKKEIMEEMLRKGIIHDIYWPHFFFFIVSFLLVPIAVGFYVGRHSKRSKFLYCFFITVIVSFFEPTMDLLFDADIKGFLLTVFLIGYFISPSLFMLTALGALIGSGFKANHDKGLYLTIYRYFQEKHKKGFLFLVIVIVLSGFSLKNFEKNIDDFLSPYYRYFYAKVDFNKAFGGGKQPPLLRIVKPTPSTSDDPDRWPELISLDDGDDLAFIIFVNNSNFIYEAVNTKLSLLQNDLPPN